MKRLLTSVITSLVLQTHTLKKNVFRTSIRTRSVRKTAFYTRSDIKSIVWLRISASMFSLEFGKIYRIFLISSVSKLFGNSS